MMSLRNLDCDKVSALPRQGWSAGHFGL